MDDFLHAVSSSPAFSIWEGTWPYPKSALPYLSALLVTSI